MNDDLIFERIGDINCLYSCLYIYMKGEGDPFMEIGVTEDKSLEFTVFKNKENIALSVEQWDEIVRRGREFLLRAIADEDAYM